MAADIANVKSFGAKGDNSTDDTAAIQAAVNSLPSATGGKVVLPQNSSGTQTTYCVKTGPITTSTTNVTFEGAANGGGVQVSACGADSAIFSLSGFGDTLRDMFVAGSKTVSTTNPAVEFTATCSQCTLDHVGINHGQYNLKVDGSEFHVTNSTFSFAYGSALVFLGNAAGTVGGYILHSSLDQNAPGASPTAASLTAPIAWQAATAYAVNNIVSTGGFYIQATAVTGDDKSGAVAPTVLSYGNDIADNHVTWRLLGPTTYYALQADAGTTETFLSDDDFSGLAFTASLALTNTLSGAAPQRVFVHHAVMASMFENVLASGGGNTLSVQDSELNYCAVTTCAGVAPDSTWVGDLTITGNHIFADHYGVALPANFSKATIAGNKIGSAVLGASTVGISVTAGTSDYLEIFGNDLSDSTSQVAYGALSGTHNLLQLTGSAFEAPAGGIYDGSTAPTGTGAYVHATSPILVTPTLGVASATTLAVGGSLISGDTATFHMGTNINFSVNTTGGNAVLLQAENDAANTNIPLHVVASASQLQDAGTIYLSTDGSGHVSLPAIASNTGAQTGYVCRGTGGLLTYDGTNTCLVSSLRFKRDVATVEDPLAIVMAMPRVISFRYKDKHLPGLRYGQAAEEMAARVPLDARVAATALTRLVKFDPQGRPLAIDYEEEIPLLVGAIQAQQREIKMQARRIAELEQRIK